jgi:hypothetical protein
MRARIGLVTALAPLVALSAQAQVAETFVEGHVFNRKTGVPIAGAVVTLPDGCIPCQRIPVPTVITTDDNGFYSARFIGGSSLMTVPIEAACTTRSGEITGASQADLRPGTVRRDIFLRVPGNLSRCLPPQ